MLRRIFRTLLILSLLSSIAGGVVYFANAVFSQLKDEDRIGIEKKEEQSTHTTAEEKRQTQTSNSAPQSAE
ncbi:MULTISPECIES: hypothetical protein [unclassified Enterococcus]|uniref:hypothetical protein n=1 Tax=unclassified Enterococcus TaxID=2608891 RepID=UPI0013EC833B|nr:MULTISPECIES: hypothetical protein [unclassified Enterococcus]